MSELTDILQSAARLLAPCDPITSSSLSAVADASSSGAWDVLVSGLCSVGKSSFVCSLWGDAELLPTAVRDCTQTNTLIRAPLSGETERTIRLKFLDRPIAVRFALRSLASHRLTGMLQDFHGIALPRFDEMLPEDCLRYIATESRRVIAQRSDLLVLNEPLTDELEQLENFLEFIDSPAYLPGQSFEVPWDERREFLMGLRRPDGRLTGSGKLMALECVELLRSTPWQPAHLPPPLLTDTPWIPAHHNARREDLILASARRASILVVLALPQRYECESWLLKLLRERPDLSATTLFVFNQIDTVDPRTLFSRDGFLGIYEDNRARLLALGFDPANIFLACSRLSFLKLTLNSDQPSTPSLFGASSVAERIARLEKTLVQIRENARSRPDGEFKNKLLDACATHDAGIESVRHRLVSLAQNSVRKRREIAAIDTFLNIEELNLSTESLAVWRVLKDRARDLKIKIRAS